MVITREIDYAVRIIRDLSRGGRKKIDEICRNELIPRQFSYKILKKLEKSGLVKIFRGADGGYALTADYRNLSLFDIIVSINKELVFSECLGHGYNCPLNIGGKAPCGVHAELERIQAITFAHLKEKKLPEIFK